MPSIQIQGSNIVETSIQRRILRINGETFEIPEYVAKSGNSISQINGEVFINGFEFDHKQKKFRRTLRSLYHLFF